MEGNILDEDFKERKNHRVEYVGFWARVGASLIDLLVIIPIIVLVFLNIVYLKSLAADFLLALLMIGYKPYFEYKYGATFGKMALRIKVVTEQFENIDIQTTLVRNFLWILPGIISMYHSFLVFTHPDFDGVNSLVLYGTHMNDVPDPTGGLVNFLVLIAAIMVAFTKKKQGGHDLLAKTYCIYNHE